MHKCFKFTELINRFKFPVLLAHGRYYKAELHRTGLSQSAKLSALPDLRVLNGRVELTKQNERNSISDAFTITICGSVHAPTEMHYVTLLISIMDVTDGIHRPKPVQSRSRQQPTSDGHVPDRPMFCYNTNLGKLPNQITTLSDWTKVAQLNTDWLIFPRRGKRNLQFIISILSRQNGQELAGAKCNFTYMNPEFGYIDVKENTQRTKILAVALAFAISAADRKLYNCEIELIKKWARSSFDYARESNKTRRKFEKALDKTVTFFRNGNQLDTYAICKEIVEIAPTALRYDILDLCLRVARANGSVVAEELAILKDLANWLEVDMNRFRAMMEKILPIRLHQVRDVEATLGVTADMNREKTRRQLNKEYGKWNSRATSPDPKIRAQADQMLKLIAKARCENIG
jgi:tellurite resistance protein